MSTKSPTLTPHQLLEVMPEVELSGVVPVNIPVELYIRLALDPIIRREAGEGWHENGLNFVVLGASAVREFLLDEMNKGTALERNQPGHPEFQAYQQQAQYVIELKEDLGITDPPPLEPNILMSTE